MLCASNRIISHAARRLQAQGSGSKGSVGQQLAAFSSMTAIFVNTVAAAFAHINRALARMSSGTSTVTAPSAASPDSPPYPHQLSEDAVSSFNLELPYLPESSMSPEVAASAASLRMQFACASREVQSLMRSMRNVWLQWHLPPAVAPGITSGYLFNHLVHICSLTLVFTPC